LVEQSTNNPKFDDSKTQIGIRISSNCQKKKNLNEKRFHLSSKVLEDSSRVDSRGGADATVRSGPALQVTVDTTDGELRRKKGNA
jgi:hypothetical protein